jgi:hypothetical protein
MKLSPLGVAAGVGPPVVGYEIIIPKDAFLKVRDPKLIQPFSCLKKENSENQAQEWLDKHTH